MKNIPHTSHYFIDKTGTIYSIKPHAKSIKNLSIPIILKPQTQKNGYRTVNIEFNNKRKTMLIGYLTLLTFVSDRPTLKHQVCHGIKGKSDDSLSNLSWKTCSQNNKEDKERDNTLMLGEKHFRSKLKNADIPVIRDLHSLGKSNHEIANIYNVHHSSISKIIKGHTWIHIL
jgi:hypothetical protein